MMCEHTKKKGNEILPRSEIDITDTGGLVYRTPPNRLETCRSKKCAVPLYGSSVWWGQVHLLPRQYFHLLSAGLSLISSSQVFLFTKNHLDMWSSSPKYVQKRHNILKIKNCFKSFFFQGKIIIQRFSTKTPFKKLNHIYTTHHFKRKFLSTN